MSEVGLCIDNQGGALCAVELAPTGMAMRGKSNDLRCEAVSNARTFRTIAGQHFRSFGVEIVEGEGNV